jgi:hypothetical protein
MLSAAAAVLLALPGGVRADITVSSSTDTALTTTANGNITIDSNGSISVNNGGAIVTLDSNNSVTNNGILNNGNNDNALGIQIDTSAGNILAQGSGLVSTNTITLSGDGLNRVGVLVTGGNHYYGGISIGNSTGVNINGAAATINVQGDASSSFRQTAGTSITGDILFGGSFTTTPNSKASGAGSGTMFSFNGPVYGNVGFDSTVASSNIGAGAIGVAILGGIHTCASDTTAAAAGFTCGTGVNGLGILVNGGKIVTVGQVFIDPASKDPVLEGGPALIVGSSIDGGIYNSGPFTGNGTVPLGAFSANGTDGRGTVYIDPAASGLGTPINIGPVTTAFETVDPGYSFINRGTIASTPAVEQISTAAMFIQGSAPTVYTCLGNGDLATCGSDGKGGLLDTGAISAVASTNITGVVTQNVTATALAVGSWANIPRIDVKAELEGLSTNTPGIINAGVSGTSGGIATAITIAQGAVVPVINVGQNAQIVASVTTSNLTPTADVATIDAPFTLVATAISDGSSTLKTINNAGKIQASITTVTPGPGATVVSSVRAIDLTSSTANGIKINNSGQILGDLIFGSGGNNYTLNVGNIGGAANAATGVSNSPNNYAVIANSIVASGGGGATPTTQVNIIDFGAGTGHVLDIGAFGYVNSIIKANPNSLAVTVENNGTLYIANTGSTGSLNASTFNINGGTLGLTISQNTTATTPVIRAGTSATIQPNSTVAMQFGSFISSGTTLASVTNPTTQNIVLISAPTITVDPATLALNNQLLAQNLPFLFQSPKDPLDPKLLQLTTAPTGDQNLVLSLTPRAPGATNPDGTPGLGLTGDALAQFPYVASALATDPSLGSAIATSLTVYNTPGASTSGINVAASQQQAQQAFTQFGPDTSGGARQVAILITDQASGPVAARQRLLRSYGKVAGDLTLWGTEFVGNINNKGRVDADGTLTNYKDHGFGFSLGLDSGSPRGGWYGGAFTFYSGDVTQTLPRNTKTHTQWYMLTGYTDWQGGHLYVDSQFSLAYGDFNGTRDLVVGGLGREAAGKRAALMGALGGNMGAIFRSGAFQFTPHISLDGLAMREEGYTETGGGSGFDLQVAPYYANSLRTALGADVKTNLNLWGFTLSPEARVGYRYDLINTPVKLKAGFFGTGGLNTAGNSMTFVGPDPDTGNVIGGLSLGAGTDTWHLGVNYDFLRGNNGSTTQVGTVTLLGRI